jgi:PAS domain-containing protein
MGMWFEVNAYPSDDGLSVYFRNITDTKRVEEALRHAAAMLSATLDATPDGILVISKEGRISGHNKKFREMWNIPAEVMATGDDERALAVAAGQLADPEGFLRKVRELYARPDDESFDLLRFKDGRVFERVSKPQRIDGEVVGRVWSFREITQAQPAASEAKPAARRRS